VHLTAPAMLADASGIDCARELVSRAPGSPEHRR
jgi:hypothetical protein